MYVNGAWHRGGQRKKKTKKKTQTQHPKGPTGMVGADFLETIKMCLLYVLLRGHHDVGYTDDGKTTLNFLSCASTFQLVAPTCKRLYIVRPGF